MSRTIGKPKKVKENLINRSGLSLLLVVQLANLICNILL